LVRRNARRMGLDMRARWEGKDAGDEPTSDSAAGGGSPCPDRGPSARAWAGSVNSSALGGFYPQAFHRRRSGPLFDWWADSSRGHATSRQSLSAPTDRSAKCWTVVLSAALLIWAALIPASAAEPSKRVLLIVGDSISAAYGLPAGSGWTDLLAARLAKQGF